MQEYCLFGFLVEAAAVITQDWRDGRCCYEIYPYTVPNFPKPHLDLEF